MRSVRELNVLVRQAASTSSAAIGWRAERTTATRRGTRSAFLSGDAVAHGLSVERGRACEACSGAVEWSCAYRGVFVAHLRGRDVLFEFFEVDPRRLRRRLFFVCNRVASKRCSVWNLEPGTWNLDYLAVTQPSRTQILGQDATLA